ncbi:MAG: hypothetical protein OWQ48_00230 [Desulfurococcus sp.]|nr:hypothetical protein [Desulfurococcus sp.]
MRIVHVAPFYYPIIDGVEEIVKRIAKYMISQCYDAHAVTYNRWLRSSEAESLLREDLINCVHVIRLKSILSIHERNNLRETGEVACLAS